MKKIFNLFSPPAKSCYATQFSIFNYLKLICSIALLLYCSIALLPLSYAQEATQEAEIQTTENKDLTPTPKDKESQLEKIRKLKERVATKVAELREKGRKAYHGEIKEITDSTIILITKKGEVTVTVGEETNIFRVATGKKRKINLKDLEEGEKILALGVTDQEELPAKVIIVKALPLIIHGKVTQVNTEQGTINIKTPKENEFLVDYEKNTECKIYEKGLPALPGGGQAGRQGKGLLKCGLSQIEVEDRVHVIATQGKEENRITALRILVLPGKALGLVGKEEVTPTSTVKSSPPETE